MEISLPILIFELAVLVFSVMAHEVAHGVVANKLGDPTAKLAGRLNFNPLNHLDPVGSILVPLILYFSTGVVFGWAKPVPYNPENLKNPKKGAGLIAAAGPATNFLIAIAFGIILRLLSFLPLESAMPSFYLASFLNIIIVLNLSLAVFNFIPIPPLDGSKILFMFMPGSWYRVRLYLERYELVWIILILLLGFQFIRPIVTFLYNLIGF